MGNGKVSLTLSFVVLCKNWIQNGFSTFFLFFNQNMQDVFLCIHAYCTKGCYLELSQLCHWTDPLVQEIYDVEEEKMTRICCSKQYPLSSLQLKGSRSLCWHKKRKNINLKIHFLIAKRPVPAEWTAVKFCCSKSQIYINCSWKMPSEFFFSFDCSFTVPTNSIRDPSRVGDKRRRDEWPPELFC